MRWIDGLRPGGGEGVTGGAMRDGVVNLRVFITREALEHSRTPHVLPSSTPLSQAGTSAATVIGSLVAELKVVAGSLDLFRQTVNFDLLRSIKLRSK